jgi:DNA ligase-1
MRTTPEAASESALTLARVDAVLSAIAGVKGKGSVAERERLLGELMSHATEPEQRFLRALLYGELRQGALAGILVDAIARAASTPVQAVRRAAMLSGDLSEVARAAIVEGEAALSGYALELFRPVEPMLAQTCDEPSEAVARFGQAALEHKLDGARIQVHKSGAEVVVFTRTLKEVTARVPEIVELVRELPARELVLDGEVLALDAQGRPRSFQTTMRRFGRKLDVEELRAELPLTPFFFDLLHLDGETIVDRPGRERYAALHAALPAACVVPQLVTDDAGRARAFLDEALGAGHEGIMAKSLDAPYAAGRRGAEWLKIKPAHTLDLVVLAAEWGHGRRRGWLSNLHLGARNADGTFTMLGKTFKGMTDATLRWQTEQLLERSLARDGHVVHVRPELVVEVAFNDLQASPHYPGGLALRFARIKRYRPDKRAEDADTIETVRAIHAGGKRG